LQSEEGQSDDNEYDDDKNKKRLQKQYLNEVIIIARPTAIKFPKHTRPVI